MQLLGKGQPILQILSMANSWFLSACVVRRFLCESVMAWDLQDLQSRSTQCHLSSWLASVLKVAQVT